MELIMNAASQSSAIPPWEKEAARGMVPYIQRGEAMPRALAGITPSAPSFFLWMEPNSRWMAPLQKTEITDPITIPSTQ